jgi:hypothetical protein
MRSYILHGTIRSRGIVLLLPLQMSLLTLGRIYRRDGSCRSIKPFSNCLSFITHLVDEVDAVAIVSMAADTLPLPPRDGVAAIDDDVPFGDNFNDNNGGSGNGNDDNGTIGEWHLNGDDGGLAIIVANVDNSVLLLLFVSLFIPLKRPSTLVVSYVRWHFSLLLWSLLSLLSLLM